MVAYAWTGFSLSMIYGPMTKMVAESTDLIYATRCSLGYTFSSFFGSPMAGLLATFLSWQATFNVSSIVLVIMAVTCFICFAVFEKRGVVKYGEPTKGSDRPKKDYKALIKRSIIKFAAISMINGYHQNLARRLPQHLLLRLPRIYRDRVGVDIFHRDSDNFIHGIHRDIRL